MLSRQLSRDTESRLQGKLKSLAVVGCLLVILMSLLVLAGWVWDIGFLKQPFPRHVAMNPLTAVCFILVCMGVLLQSLHVDKPAKGISYFLGIFVCGICALKLLNIITHSTFQIDQTLFEYVLQKDSAGNISNQMAPTAAFNFILSSIALLLLKPGRQKQRLLAHRLAFFVSLVAVFTLTGYLYHVKEFYSPLSYQPMSFHDALAFLFLSAAILCINANNGMMGRILQPFTESVPKFILLLGAVLIPFLGGFIFLTLHAANLLYIELTIALLVMGIIITYLGTVWYAIALINKNDFFRKKAELELTLRSREIDISNHNLQKINKTLEEFTSVAGHDLQEPQRKIIFFTDMLNEKYKDQLGEAGQSLVSRIMSASNRMSALIESILEYSRISNKELKNEDVEPNLVIDEILSDIDGVVKEKKALIKVAPLRVIHGDHTQIKQIFQNLLSNALKFTDKDLIPVINIDSSIIETTAGNNVNGNTASPAAQFQQITVTDNGIGFSQEDSERIFEQFKRLNSAAKYPGTGIGLAIVKKSIENHGGTIMATSAKGQGTTFTMAFPL